MTGETKLLLVSRISKVDCQNKVLLKIMFGDGGDASSFVKRNVTKSVFMWNQNMHGFNQFIIYV